MRGTEQRGARRVVEVEVAELELELIQPHMAQKSMLRGEVGCTCVAREVSVERGGMGSSRRSREDMRMIAVKILGRRSGN